MSELNDLEKLLMKEFHKCQLVAVNASLEYSEPEGRNFVVVAFGFESEDGNRTFWRKVRIFSNRSDVREKAMVALKELDRAVNAGGVLVRIVTECEAQVFDSGSNVVQLFSLVEASLERLEPVRITYGYSETMNHRTKKPYLSGYVSRIHPWIPDYNERSVDGDPVMRDAVNFCFTREWLEVRMKVFEAVGTVCMCCGATKENAVMTVDHIKPRSKYPTLALSPSNLQVLCRECNKGKGNSSEMDYRSGDQVTALNALEYSMAQDND